VIDSHTHLHLCDPPNAELVEAAVQAGVTRIVTVGTNPATNRLALEAAGNHPEVYAALGHHPNEATGFGAAELADLAELATHPRCVAIGETGLDYYRDHASQADQQRAFEAQIDLAHRVDKPLVIHTRSADQDTLDTLRTRAAGLNVILHCFSMADRVAECLEQPTWWFSFAGNVTFPKAVALRQAMLRVPAERLLVETDAPYLAPQPTRGRPNQPAYVTHTARAVATQRRVEYEELERAIEATAARLFRW
jgi:TatD DNase family protein